MTAVIMTAVIAAIFAGDLYLKNKIEETMQPGGEREILGGKLLIRRYHNRGAALNLGEKKRPGTVVLISAVLCVVLTAAFVCSLLTGRGNALMRWGLTLLLGGAYSNTYDRLRRRYVVDYVSFGVKWKRLRRIVFNFSDFCIMIGAALMAIGSIGADIECR